MPYTDNPLADFEGWDREQNKQLEQLPVCSHCGQAIQEEELWDINGELYHIDCAESEFKKRTEDYIR